MFNRRSFKMRTCRWIYVNRGVQSQRQTALLLHVWNFLFNKACIWQVYKGGALAEHRRMRNYLQRVEREGVQRVKMFLVITAAYVVFWGPLFLVTLVHRPALGSQLGYEVGNLSFFSSRSLRFFNKPFHLKKTIYLFNQFLTIYLPYTFSPFSVWFN